MSSKKARTSRTKFGMAVLAAISVAALLVNAPAPATAEPAARQAATYRNPVSASFAETFADPSIIQGKDGFWYAYSTADPLKAGDVPGIMHIARTRDFVSWEYEGTVFTADNRPVYAEPSAGLWAPDVRYLNGQYVMYFTVTDTRLNPGDDSAIGVATAPEPTGPWTPTDAPIVPPRKNVNDYFWTFDPAGFTDVDGQQYLYFGSYYGGDFVTRVSDDGLTPVGGLTQVAIDNRYEGPYVIRHGDWYYLMASAANCCAGPTTGYSVFAGRSKSPMGPFVDDQGTSLMESRVGGTPVITQNGNRFIGVGHHAVATDAAGQEFIVYHGIDRNKPWLNEPFGINRRPMLIDRLDWVDGWPKARAGAGPSDTRQPAPVTGSAMGIQSDNPAAGGFRHLAPGPADPQGGNTARLRGAAITRRQAPADSVRVRLDLRGNQPITLTLGRSPKRTTVTVDPTHQKLSVTTRVGHSERTKTTALANRAGWRTLLVEVAGTSTLAQVSQSDLNDPMAEVSLSRPGFRLSPAPIKISGKNVVLDNITVRPLAKQAARPVPVPQPGKKIIGEEFTNSQLGKEWTWVRRDDKATVSNGKLNWPVQDADLVGTNNTAGLLLHDTPAGDWIAETKLHLDLGANDIRNYQQAGMIAYAGDDDFARLGTVAIWNTRQTEYGRELVATADGRTSYGGAVIGTSGPNMWLRLAHHVNRDGEQLYRAATSRDGHTWTWGAVWTFDPGLSGHRGDTAGAPRIGLYAHGGSQPANVASFDYLRFFRTHWPATR